MEDSEGGSVTVGDVGSVPSFSEYVVYRWPGGRAVSRAWGGDTYGPAAGFGTAGILKQHVGCPTRGSRGLIYM